MHANSANMLSLRQGFCTFNSALFIHIFPLYVIALGDTLSSPRNKAMRQSHSLGSLQVHM